MKFLIRDLKSMEFATDSEVILIFSAITVTLLQGTAFRHQVLEEIISSGFRPCS